MSVIRIAGSPPVFVTHREAMRHYEPPLKPDTPSPFRVLRPPSDTDFRAHGAFQRGELSIERTGQDGWGGSFGYPSSVHFAWSGNQATHNHPGASIPMDTLASSVDVGQLAIHGHASTITSQYGIFRTRQRTDRPILRHWPRDFSATVYVRNRHGYTSTLRPIMEYGPDRQVHQMLCDLFHETAEQDDSLGFSSSFFAPRYPIGTTPRGNIELGEVGFLTWDHFSQLFRTLNDDPWQLVSPDQSWIRLFRPGERSTRVARAAFVSAGVASSGR